MFLLEYTFTGTFAFGCHATFLMYFKMSIAKVKVITKLINLSEFSGVKFIFKNETRNV